MMKQTMKVLVIALIAVSVQTTATVAQRGSAADEIRVGPFNSISVAVAGEIYLKQGPEQRVIAEGSERVVENLVAEVKNGNLTLRMPPRWRYRRGDELTVYITVPELNGVTLSGSASMFTEGPLKTRSMTVVISGSGRVNFEELNADQLDVTVSGSGRLNVGGGSRLEKSSIVISGSGRFDAPDVPVEKANAVITGSGSCRIHVLSDLNVRISGSGRVSYSGNPLIDARVTGSGRVVSAN